MTNKKTRKIPFFSLILVLIALIASIGGTVTFSRFYDGYRNINDSVKVADAVAKIEVNQITLTDAQGTKQVKFDANADTVTVNDVEPEDVIEYYFTVHGTDGKRVNEVNMNLTVSIGVRLETIYSGSALKKHYFAGWQRYSDEAYRKDVRYCGYLQIFHGNGNDIRQPETPTETVDFTGKSLAVVEGADNSIVNKTGLVMRADDDVKEYAYRVRFTLPKQTSETENYAGATVYFDINVLAEQTQNI